ncbi:hypothetical protein JTB14_020736 [Gonioctena quinquepunctata]|nr:hypothetical protein JTB14_020736 [Gonioctena quinquepunctata]
MDKSEVTMKDVYMLIEEVNTNLGQRIEKTEVVTNNLSTDLYTEVEKIKTKVERLEEENQQLKNSLYKIEKKIVTNNLVFYCIHEAPKEQPKNLEEKVRELAIDKLIGETKQPYKTQPTSRNEKY